MEGLEDTFSDLASFSLANSLNDTNNVLKIDYYYYLIYIGIALLIILIGVYLYKYLNRKKVHFSELNNEMNQINQMNDSYDNQ